MDVRAAVQWDGQLWCSCEKAMANEVPVLRAVTQKGETGNMWLLGLLWDISVRGRLLLWDGVDLLLDCVCLDAVITRLLWSDIMITESQSCHLAAISVFWVSTFLCKSQTILSTSAGCFSAHSYRTWGLPQQKIVFLKIQSTWTLCPLSMQKVVLLVTGKGLVQKDFWEEKYWNVFSCLTENFSGSNFISFTLLKFLLVLFLLRLCFGPYPNQKFPEMVFRMKASTHICYFLQMNKGLRKGC